MIDMTVNDLKLICELHDNALVVFDRQRCMGKCPVCAAEARFKQRIAEDADDLEQLRDGLFKIETIVRAKKVVISDGNPERNSVPPPPDVKAHLPQTLGNLGHAPDVPTPQGPLADKGPL